MDYNNLYNNLNKIYQIFPDITKLFIYDFNNLSPNVIKYSPLLKLNKLIKKNKNTEQYKNKLNKEIIKTNNWIEFSAKNQEKTILNEKFKTYCIENQIDPNFVNQQLQTENVFISKKQLKKQVFIYKKNTNQYQAVAMQLD
jgi:hypothetical protein